MKKNAMLKIAAILLVAVLLTTCAISSTFAKYVSAGSTFTSNTARVAKWGVKAATTVTGPSTLFANSYGTIDTTASSSTKNAATTETSTFIVAPGTSNSVTVSTAVAEGTPEVSGKITVTPSVVFGSGWKGTDGTSFYCPLKITVGSTTVDCSTKNSAEAVNEALAAAAFTAYFNAGESLAEIDDIGGTVAWSWDWVETDDQNLKDTYLGDHTDNTTVQLSFATTVEQTGPAGTPTT